MKTIALQGIKNGVRRFPSGIWLMTGLDLLMTMGWASASPFLALYLHDERGLSMSLVGALFLAAGLSSGGASLIGGMLSDRFGRRRVFVVVCALNTVTSAAMAALTAATAPVWIIMSIVIVSWCIGATGSPSFNAIIADLSPGDRLAESYALVRTGGNLGFAIGPAVGGFLISYRSYGAVFGFAALVGVAVTVFVYLLMAESYGRREAWVDMRSTFAVARDRRFLVFAIATLLLVLLEAQFGSTLSVFAVNRLSFSAAQYGLLLTSNGLLVTVFQYAVTRLAGNLNRPIGLILGTLFYVAGYLSLGWIDTFGMAMFTVVLLTAGEVTMSPISSAAVAESAPEDKRGRYMGFFGLTQTVGMALAPLFGGVLLDSFATNPRLLWGLIASVGVVAAIGFRAWGKMASKHHYLTHGETK